MSPNEIVRLAAERFDCSVSIRQAVSICEMWACFPRERGVVSWASENNPNWMATFLCWLKYRLFELVPPACHGIMFPPSGIKTARMHVFDLFERTYPTPLTKEEMREIVRQMSTKRSALPFSSRKIYPIDRVANRVAGMP